MQKVLNRLFRIRSGEWRVVLLLQLQIFLIIAVLLLAKPAGNAIFINRFGSAALPYMYILTAIVAGLISMAYALALRYFTILRVNLWSLGICLLSLLGFGAIFPFESTKDIVAIGLYLWVALFGVLAASQFWMIANLVFDIRQAKRLFGPIGAGAIAGGIAGGYLANIIAGSLGTRALLFVAGALLLPCFFISIYVWQKYISGKASKLARKRKTAELRERPHRLIKSSKHLMLLCGIISLSVVTAKLIDYQFSALAAASIQDENQLTAFFGFWFSTFNLIGLVVQLLITQRVVQRMGVSGTLLFLPAGLSIGTMLMFITPGLGAAIFSRLVDGSLKQSLHRAGVEMLFLPVSQEIKERIKTYIDVFIDSAAGGLGGLLLLLLVEGLGLSPPWISIPVLLLVMAWLVCVLLIREEYLDAFREQLRQLRPRKRKPSLQSNHKAVLAGFLKVLEGAAYSDKEKQLLYVLERTEKLPVGQFREPIMDLLLHKNPTIRARALRSLTAREEPAPLDQVIALLKDPNSEVQFAAVEHLVAHHLETANEEIETQLSHDEARIAGIVLVNLLGQSRGNAELKERWHLHEHFLHRVAMLPNLPPAAAQQWRLKLIQAAGRSRVPQFYTFISDNLLAEDPAIREAAIIAAGESLDERWLITLIGLLSEARFRPFAKAALVQYGLGLVNLLPSYFKSHAIDITDIRRLPQVLEQISSQQTVELIFEMMERFFPADLEFRLEALKALNVLQRDNPQLYMPTSQVTRHILNEARTYQTTIDNLAAESKALPESSAALKSAREGLLNLLETRQEGNLDRLFRLLGLRYSPTDIIPIHIGLRSANRQQQLNAVEFLDNLLDSPLKRVLIPILENQVQESTSIDMTSERFEEQEFQNFRKILNGQDQRLKLAVLHLIGFLPAPRYEALLELYTIAESKPVRDMAAKALHRYRRRSMRLKPLIF